MKLGEPPCRSTRSRLHTCPRFVSGSPLYWLDGGVVGHARGTTKGQVRVAPAPTGLICSMAAKIPRHRPALVLSAETVAGSNPARPAFFPAFCRSMVVGYGGNKDTAISLHVGCPDRQKVGERYERGRASATGDRRTGRLSRIAVRPAHLRYGMGVAQLVEPRSHLVLRRFESGHPSRLTTERHEGSRRHTRVDADDALAQILRRLAHRVSGSPVGVSRAVPR